MSFAELKNITKTYPGIRACSHVSLSFERGEVHALLGENGAGKTTLMKILCGLTRPDEGQILVDGREVSLRSPGDAIRCGIGMVHQHFMLIPTLTVVENVLLSLNEKQLFARRKEVSARLEELSEKYGLRVDPSARVSDLTVGEQQRVEILKALYRSCDLLILDEPTAVLTPGETEELFKAIRSLLKEGRGVVFISHKMKEVLSISDRITVLRQGQKIASLLPGETDAQALAELMVGRPVKELPEKKEKKEGETILEVNDLHVRRENGTEAVRGMSFQIRAGEIYGLAGVDGNGQSELVRAVTGLTKARGSIRIRGEEILGRKPGQILEKGVSHIPEDRRQDGLILSASVRDNLVLDTFSQKKYRRGPFLKRRELDRQAERLRQNYDIRTPDISLSADSLSGGNQQKLVAAREMDRCADLILAVHPVRGMDVGATEFIHEELMAARERGAAILLVSTELDEILDLSDRIGIIYEGRLVGEKTKGETDRTEIGLLMAGDGERGS